MEQSSPHNDAQAILISDLIIHLLRDSGIDRIYGSPGTTDLSLVRSSAQYGIKYIFAVHDSVAVGMADGFARASNYLSVVNLHSTQGLLNSCGFIRTAFRDNIPLLIIASIPSTSYDIYEPNHFLLNLEQALTPITKWGWKVSEIETIVQVLNRATKIASSTPQGPTFILIPQNILEKEISPLLSPLERLPSKCAVETVPTNDSLEQAAKSLTDAQHPTIFAGYGSQGAIDLTQTLSEIIAAPVIAESLDRGPQVHNVYCRTTYPLFLSFFDIRDEVINEQIRNSDVLLFVGGKASYSKIIGEIPVHTTVIQMNDNLGEIRKYHKIDIELLGHFEKSMEQLCNRVGSRITQNSLTGPIEERRRYLVSQIAGYKKSKSERLSKVLMKGETIVGMQLIKAMTECLPSKAIIVDDSQGMGFYLKHYYSFSEANTLYGSMASHIGWALPAALGIKQARESELVVCLVGDGSFLFAIQALAAASTFNIPVLVIIANNRGYISLKKEISVKWPPISKEAYPLSLNKPAFDYATLTKSFGLSSIRVSDASELNQVLQAATDVVLQEKKTCIVDVIMSDLWEDWDESWYVTQQNKTSS